MTAKFHPMFNRAAASHKMRNEKEVKEEARAKSSAASVFWVGMDLKVVSKGRHTITVEFFDGQDTALRTLEVCVDDQPDSLKGDDDDRDRELPYPDALDILTEGEGE